MPSILTSSPIMNKRKYIPNWAKKTKVSEEVMEEKGLLTANITPKSKAANTHGIRIFSNNLPTTKVNKKAPARNKKIFSIV
jgi:hypothetical protein